MPQGSNEDENQVAEGEGQESPEDKGVAQPSQVNAPAAGVHRANPLQDLALAQHDSR